MDSCSDEIILIQSSPDDQQWLSSCVAMERQQRRDEDGIWADLPDLSLDGIDVSKLAVHNAGLPASQQQQQQQQPVFPMTCTSTSQDDGGTIAVPPSAAADTNLQQLLPELPPPSFSLEKKRSFSTLYAACPPGDPDSCRYNCPEQSDTCPYWLSRRVTAEHKVLRAAEATRLHPYHFLPDLLLWLVEDGLLSAGDKGAWLPIMGPDQGSWHEHLPEAQRSSLLRTGSEEALLDREKARVFVGFRDLLSSEGCGGSHHEVLFFAKMFYDEPLHDVFQSRAYKEYVFAEEVTKRLRERLPHYRPPLWPAAAFYPIKPSRSNNNTAAAERCTDSADSPCTCQKRTDYIVLWDWARVWNLRQLDALRKELGPSKKLVCGKWPLPNLSQYFQGLVEMVEFFVATDPTDSGLAPSAVRFNHGDLNATQICFDALRRRWYLIDFTTSEWYWFGGAGNSSNKRIYGPGSTANKGRSYDSKDEFCIHLPNAFKHAFEKAKVRNTMLWPKILAAFNPLATRAQTLAELKTIQRSLKPPK